MKLDPKAIQIDFALILYLQILNSICSQGAGSHIEYKLHTTLTFFIQLCANSSTYLLARFKSRRQPKLNLEMTENLNKKDKNWIICQELGKCSATENFCQQDVVACGKWFTKGAYHFLNSILNQGNLLKGIDKKIVRREGIEPITIVFTYVLFSVTYFL